MYWRILGYVDAVRPTAPPAAMLGNLLEVGLVSALEDMRPFDHGLLESTRLHHSARIRRVTMTHTTDGRPRARGLGISLPGDPGPLNAITDVRGVEVGVTTLIDGDGPGRRRVRCAPA